MPTALQTLRRRLLLCLLVMVLQMMVVLGFLCGSCCMYSG
jgi:hypothetical protein